MGIKGFEKFIRNRNGDKKIAQQISIRDEITAWRHLNGKDPTIVIDLKELNRVVEKIDEGGLIFGGKFAKINEIVEYFFDEMKKCNANLVFFARLDEGKYKDIDMFSPLNLAYDCINQRKCLKTYLSYGRQTQASNLIPSERNFYNLQQICTKYGQFYVNYGLSKRAILAYAREKRDDVMAVMTRNTEFFVHNCSFEYWSLSDVDFSALKIAKFCRIRLEHTLGFSTHQMQLLLVLSQLKPADKFKLVGKGYGNPFINLLSYVENQRCDPDGYDFTKLRDTISEHQIKEMENQISELEELNRFAGSFNEDINDEFITELMDIDIIFDMVLLFVKQNIPFVYKLINETMSTPKDLLFIDVRRAGSVQYIDLVIHVTLKMIGIVFKDISLEQRPKTRAVKINRNPVPFRPSTQMQMDIIYPTLTLPKLVDLIAKEDDHSLADARWNLLMWLLNVDKDALNKIRTSADSKYIRISNLTLQFLSTNSIMSIDSVESESIRRTEKEVQDNIHAQRLARSPPEFPNEPFPQYVDLLWIQAAHKYTIAFELVCHCFEVCGLRNETALIQFDAFKFHGVMRERVEDNCEQLMPSMQKFHFLHR